MGFAPPNAPGAEASTPEGLHALWTQAGFVDLEARVVRTRRTLTDFEDYWSTTIAAPNIAPKLATLDVRVRRGPVTVTVMPGTTAGELVRESKQG
jgi:hypothetical protein